MNKSRCCVYELKYHIVWCVKYRRKILNEDISKFLKEKILQICLGYDILLEEIETDKDHVHMLISCKPTHYMPDVVQILKGSTSFQLMKEFPILKKQLWGGHIWSPSYFISSVSENSEENIRRYIQNQGKE